jgi:hypothetical protein
MNNLTWLVLFAAGGMGFWLYRRAHSPDLLNEIYNGLKHLAFRDSQRGEPTSAERYQKMAEALMDGQSYIRNKQVSDLDHLKETSRLVLHSMSYSVLEECGIYRQNHKHACYEAAGYLVKQLDKMIERETHQKCRRA